MTRATRAFLAPIAFVALCGCAHDAIVAARHDAWLVEEMARADIADIAAGNLAVIQGGSPEVRRFGERVVDEHSALLKAGSGLANTSVPTTPGARYEPALKALQALSGSAFDRAFLERMMQQQRETLQLLDRAAAEATDPAVRAHAQKSVPRAEADLAAAQRLAAQWTSARSP